MDTIETTEEKSTSNKSTFEVEPNLKELITSEDHSGFSFNKLFNRQESAEETPIEEEKPLSRFESFRQKVDYRKPNEDRNKSKFSSNRSHGKSINTHSTQYQRQKLEQFFQNQNAISLFFFSNNDPRFRTDKFLDEEEAKSHVAEWKDRSFQIKLKFSKRKRAILHDLKRKEMLSSKIVSKKWTRNKPNNNLDIL